jgi:hypothetical protein
MEVETINEEVGGNFSCRMLVNMEGMKPKDFQ